MQTAKEINLYPISDSVKENKDMGFICLYRSIREHWIWKESRVKSKFEAWVDLLIRASHDDQKEPVGMDLIVINRGQVLTSQLQLSIDWKWDRSRVRLFLGMLTKDRMIAVKPTTKYTIITICNYESYQSKRPTKQQQANNKPTTKQHIQPLEPLEPLVSTAAAATNKTFKQWDEKEFTERVSKFKEYFPKDLLNGFWKYWTEKSATGKMRFQLEKTWDIKRRLENWQRIEETKRK
jgi:hypothetical protein